jgi:hypothetical protein
VILNGWASLPDLAFNLETIFHTDKDMCSCRVHADPPPLPPDFSSSSSSSQQFVVNELAEHRPTDWKDFVLSCLERIPRKNQRMRRLPGDQTLRHQVSPEVGGLSVQAESSVSTAWKRLVWFGDSNLEPV